MYAPTHSIDLVFLGNFVMMTFRQFVMESGQAKTESAEMF